MNRVPEHWQTKDRTDNLVHAINTGEAEYAAELEAAKKAWICPFCDLETFRSKAHFLMDESKWVAINNSRPYPGTERHLVLFPQAHRMDYRELLIDDIFTLQNFVRASVAKNTIPGWFVTMRFGNPYYSGVTINHIHGHLIQPKREIDPKIEISKLYTLTPEQLCRQTKDRVLCIENGWQVTENSLGGDEPTKHLIFESTRWQNKEFLDLEPWDLEALHKFACNYLSTCNFKGGWLAIWFWDPLYSWVPSDNLRVHFIQPQVEIGKTTFDVKPVNIPVGTEGKTNVVTFPIG